MNRLILLGLLLMTLNSFSQSSMSIDTSKILIGWWVDDNTTTVFLRDSAMLTIWDTSANVNGETFGSKWSFKDGVLTIKTFYPKKNVGWKAREYEILELSDRNLSYQLITNKDPLQIYRGKRRKSESDIYR